MFLSTNLNLMLSEKLQRSYPNAYCRQFIQKATPTELYSWFLNFPQINLGVMHRLSLRDIPICNKTF